uniref:Uncharacterized protein n=1 Tax=Arundo donax TaxID=35708 RepID=A0A0A8ZJT6_ARUDO
MYTVTFNLVFTGKSALGSNNLSGSLFIRRSGFFT